MTKVILLFTGPMLRGNLLQQCYNIADTRIMGKALSAQALAADASEKSQKLWTTLQQRIGGE